MKNLLVKGAAILLLSGCSTIATGTSQGFTVITPHTEGATCDLTDSKGHKYFIKNTPGSATVTKGDGPMVVTCRKSGYKTETITVEEGFAGATLGNLLVGGGIGIVVDAVSGAAQEYPSNVTVWLRPNRFSSESQRLEWEAEKAQYDAKIAAEEAAKSAPPTNRRR